jgi:hypothetical protein
MKIPITMVGLTALNIGAALISMTQVLQPARADTSADILRARGIQIVDGRGRVRASLTVLPATTSEAGRTEETVLLRLITEKGRPAVKIGASEQASGVSIAGPTGTKNTYAILGADATTSSLKLRSEDGRGQIIKPQCEDDAVPTAERLVTCVP